MKHYHVVDIAYAISQLHFLECYAFRRSDKGEEKHIVPSDFVEKHVKRIVEDCREQCLIVPLAAAVDRITGDFGAMINRGQMTHGDLQHQVRELRKDILRELSQLTFIFIPDDRVAEIRKSIPDWEKITGKFEWIKDDLNDHHDCYAVGQNTASIFHLMRIIEWGLRAFCIHLGFRNVRSRFKATGKIEFTPIEFTVWETMIGQIQSRVDGKLLKLRRGAAKQRAQELYLPLLADLRGFKDAWRNHVMHTRSSYTSEDVAAVASHARRFMLTLVSNGICKV